MSIRASVSITTTTTRPAPRTTRRSSASTTRSRSPAASTSRSRAGTLQSIWPSGRSGATPTASFILPCTTCRRRSPARPRRRWRPWRERWRLATGDDLSPVAATEDPWPPALEPSLHNVQVGIARTRPQCGAQAAASEVARLNEAALSGARRFIYLETQYLTAGGVGDILIRQLERPDGPEIVIVAWRSTEGWIERFVMGANRDRLIRRLLRADRYGRLRVYWLAAPGDGIEIGLHAKLMLVDDLFVRIGSSNLNNRSLGLDTECDLAIEARDATTSAAIAALRSRLLAEHLGVAPGEVEAAVARHGLIGGVDRLGGPASRLRPFEVAPDAETEPIAGTLLLDPLEPIDLDYLRRLFW